MKKNILTYVLVAVLASLSIALDYLKIPITTNLRVTLYALPLLFAGCCFDFKASLLTGLLTGVVLQLISPYGIGITSPFWALAPIGWTVTSYLLTRLFSKSNKILSTLIIVIVASIVANILNTFAMLAECWLIQDSYYTYASIATDIPSRLLVMAVMIVPYTLLLFVLVDRVGPLYKKAFVKEEKTEVKENNEETIENK